MPVHKANLKKLRELVDERRQIMKGAVAKLDSKVAAARRAPADSPLKRTLNANKRSLEKAKNVDDALEKADQALRTGCCQNDLNCDIDA
jgi:hypothetical protein